MKKNKEKNIQQRFVNITHRLDRAYNQIYKKNLGGKFQLLGSMLNALSAVSAAWAQTSASPPLSIALSAATIDLTAADDKGSTVGRHLNAVVDATLDGLLKGIESGPRGELREMEDLYNTLVDFRDHGQKGVSE